MKPHPTVMGLDISANSTGWAVGQFAWEYPKYGRWRPPKDWEWSTMQENCASFRDFLTIKVKSLGIEYIGMEAYIVPPEQFSAASHQFMFSLHTIASLVAHDCKIQAGRAAIKTWRAHFLGRSVAPNKDFRLPGEHDNRYWFKREAIRRCADRGWLTDNDDTAEALGVMDCILFGKDPDWAHRYGKYQRQTEVKAFNRAGVSA